jgi:hypothetical protein
MSQPSAKTPLIGILTEALRKAGVSKKEIDHPPKVELRDGVSGPDEQLSLGLARLLATKAQQDASDPIVACFFTEGGKLCTINTFKSVWTAIKANVDPGATFSETPVPANKEQWV